MTVSSPRAGHPGPEVLHSPCIKYGLPSPPRGPNHLGLWFHGPCIRYGLPSQHVGPNHLGLWLIGP